MLAVLSRKVRADNSHCCVKHILKYIKTIITHYFIHLSAYMVSVRCSVVDLNYFLNILCFISVSLQDR